jgi:hypothetical protein
MAKKSQTDGERVTEMRALVNVLAARLDGGMGVENLATISRQAAALSRLAKKFSQEKAQLPLRAGY